MAKKLNKEQKLAVEHGKGPLLIIAGAGTGKTTVITERIKYLISEELAKPSEILALTFTEKAANEMEERVDIAMAYGYTQMWISTFHSFCDRILRREALHIGMDPSYKLMSEADATKLIRDNIFEFELEYFRPLGNPTKFVSAMLTHFSRLQDEDITTEEYFKYAKKKQKKAESEEEITDAKKTVELANAYRKYEELKVQNGRLDFGDLITKVLKLFRDRKNVLSEYQDQFKYILVDEFQDTNYAQNEMAILLAQKNQNITVCGDDDQSIYRFRGAAVSNILQFRKRFPETKVVTLTKNYRTSQEILDKAYDLISNNNPDRLEIMEGVDKKLQSQRKEAIGQIKFIHQERVENEAEATVKAIQKLIEEENYDYKDIAILVRANNHAEPFSRALLRAGVPFQFLGPGRLFKQPEVVDLISYLKVLYNFEDSVSLYRVLSMSYFEILPRDLAKIGNYSRRYNLSLFEALEKVDDILVAEDTKKRVKKILETISRHLKLVRTESAGQILYYFLEDTGLLQQLIDPQDPEADKKAANISKFFDKLKTYEVDYDDATIPAVVDWLELSSELGESPLAANADWTQNNAVNILTVHSAKGLEFPIVFMVNLVSLRFPSMDRSEKLPLDEKIIKEVLPEGDSHTQEERRLFYVGMTRAKDKLYFTAADFYGDGKREKKLSPFIIEALGDDLVSAEQQIDQNIEQLSFLDYQPTQGLRPTSPPDLHLDYLSYSQIQTFEICPLHYKLKYILKIPTPPSSFQSFGTTIHAVLKDFYVNVGAGEKPSEKLVSELIETNWVREGYRSKKHEQRAKNNAEELINRYIEEEFNEKKIPIALEKMFKVPFEREGERVMIGGVVDRVDELADGRIEIIDYKTGTNVPSQRDVDKNMQLTIYALAAQSIQEDPFNKDPKDVKLTLNYLEEGKQITTERNKKDLEKAIDEIFDWKKKIEESDFSCSGHFFCQSCEYVSLCQADQERSHL